MTEKLCYDYKNAEPFEACITDIKPASDGKSKIILDKSVFFPEGGGQPADRGTINGVPLLDVQEEEKEILHLVSAADALNLKPGPAVLVLDSRRRLNITQLHSGQHLLSGILLNKLGAPTVSMHIGDEICTINVDVSKIKAAENSSLSSMELSEEVLVEIEEAVADAIEEDRPVITHLCPPEDITALPLRKLPPKGEEVIRVVEIKGYDTIACCGTHVSSTAGIGMLRIFGAEKYKGLIKISFLAGRRLLRDSRLLRHNAGIVSRALSVPVNDTGRGVLEFLEKTARNEKRLKELEEKVIEEKADALVRRAAEIVRAKGADFTDTAIVIGKYADSDINEVLNIGKAAQKKTGAVLVLASGKDLKFAAFSSLKDFDLRSLIKPKLEALGGRGGGNASMFQGNFGTEEALESFLKEISV